MRRFYAPPDQFIQNEVTLNLEESRHLRDVLRLQAGDDVSVFDGEGKEYRCEIGDPGNPGKGKNLSRLKVTAEIEPPAPESPLDMTLGLALLKGEKFDLVIQKATELGVNKIVPLQTVRSDVKIKPGEVKKLERWSRIALEAAKQSGRARVPVITEPAEFSDFIKDQSGATFFFSERDGAKINDQTVQIEKITAIVGPEGGWDESEISAARAGNCHVVTLGGRILRAETAGIVAVALLQNLYGDVR